MFLLTPSLHLLDPVQEAIEALQKRMAKEEEDERKTAAEATIKKEADEGEDFESEGRYNDSFGPNRSP